MAFWLESPDTLISQYREIMPTDSMTLVEKLNAMTRLSLYIGIAITLFSNDNNYLYIPIVVMALTIFIYKRRQGLMENFDEDMQVAVPSKTVPEISTLPTVNNPFMNFEKMYDPKDRAPAARSVGNPALKADIEKKFNVNLYRDAGDLYCKEHGQRQFYTMPSTTAAPDTTAFAKWCYNSDPTCKEDGRYCAPYYDPSESV